MVIAQHIHSSVRTSILRFNYHEALKHCKDLLLSIISFLANHFADSSQPLMHVVFGFSNDMDTLANPLQLTDTKARGCKAIGTNDPNLKPFTLQLNKCVKVDWILSLSCSDLATTPLVVVLDSFDCYHQMGSYVLKDNSKNHCYNEGLAPATDYFSPKREGRQLK